VLMNPVQSRIHDWQMTYDPGSKEPYGTYVLHRLLERYNAGKKLSLSNQPLRKALPSTGTGDAYLFIGNMMWMTDEDMDSLRSFISRGNTALISVSEISNDFGSISNDLFCRVLDRCDRKFATAKRNLDSAVVSMHAFPNATYDLHYFMMGKRYKRLWEYLDSTVLEWDVLGYLDHSLPNFIETTVGNGRLYLHTTPLAFTNFSLLDKRILEYDQRVLSYLSKGDIYWDLASRFDINWQTTASGSGSPFRYILSQPALRWAWFLLIALAIAYVIFLGRRAQRAVPVIEPNTNTSLEFVSMMGRLYRLQNDHRKLAQMQMSQFQSHVRDHYRIPMHEDESLLTKQIATRSGLPEQDIERIFSLHRRFVSRASVSADELAEFHTLLRNFYVNGK